MNVSTSSPTQGRVVDSDDDVQEVTSFGQPKLEQTPRHDSSDDDVPIVVNCQRRNPAENRGDRPLTRSASKPSPKKLVKRKNPAPSPYSSKPIMKNDLKAKKAVIEEIEHHWGKSFTKSYIPKCHRPLVKRGAHSRRSMYRSHETDPMNWLPSVLKAMLMTVKLTSNKKWIYKAIKNTGYRKPHLVTTDFDVVEDMLGKGWEVEYSFGVQYKHLLVNCKDEVESDEEIEHIFQVNSSDSDRSGEGESDDDDQDKSDESDSEDDDDGARGGSVSGKYQEASGYTKKGAFELSPSIPREKKQKSRKHTAIKDESSNLMLQPIHRPKEPMGYPPPGTSVEHLGRSGQGYGEYGVYNVGYGHIYGGYPGYVAAPHFPNNRRHGSQHLPPPQTHSPYGMYSPQHHQMVSLAPHTLSDNCQSHELLNIKRESPNFGEQGPLEHYGGGGDLVGGDTFAYDEDIDAQLAAAEAELKVARLRAAKARMVKK